MPVIAKADTLTHDECTKFKKQVQKPKLCFCCLDESKSSGDRKNIHVLFSKY